MLLIYTVNLKETNAHIYVFIWGKKQILLHLHMYMYIQYKHAIVFFVSLQCKYGFHFNSYTLILLQVFHWEKGSFVPNIDSKFISHSSYYYIIHMYFYFSSFFFRFFGVLCNKHTDNLNCFNLLLKEYPENIFQLSGYY